MSGSLVDPAAKGEDELPLFYAKLRCKSILINTGGRPDTAGVGKSRLSHSKGEVRSPVFIFKILMMWYIYIIYSEKLDRYYVGYTDNLSWRLQRHNQGWGRFTKGGIPWTIVYSEEFSSRNKAIKREKEIKRKKSRKYIENLILSK